MIWPFKRKHELPPDPDVDRAGAREAKARAEQQLENAKAQTDEVRNIADRLRVIRERNHFADMISEALSGTKPSPEGIYGTQDDKRAK